MRTLLLAFGLAATAAHAGVTPSTMMANVYRFSEAGAVLEVCFESAAFKALPSERADAMRGLSSRLVRLVKAIGQYYGDATVLPTYEATRSRLAGESRLKLHVKNHYEYCGERLATEMDRYLTENELLLGRYFSQDNPRSTQKRPPEPGPPKGSERR
jgi:hypothetical protein